MKTQFNLTNVLLKFPISNFHTVSKDTKEIKSGGLTVATKVGGFGD